MPIKGVSDRESLERTFTRYGKLKKGSPKQNGRVGKDLTYFRLATDDPKVAKAFRELYGEQPTRLEVYLPYPTMEENFESRRDLYGANELLKEACDGDYLTHWIEDEKFYFGRRLCTKECKDVDARCPKCTLKPSGKLLVVFEPLWKAKLIGFIEVHTHAFNDIQRIARVLAEHEPLTGKKFILWREDTMIGVPNEKTHKRMRVKKSLIYIRPTDEWLVRQLEARSREAWAQLEPGYQARAQEVAQIEAGALEFEGQVDPQAVDAEVENGVYQTEPPPETEPNSTPGDFEPDFFQLDQTYGWGTLKRWAVEHLGYADQDAVTKVLGTVFNGNTEALNYVSAWKALVDHKAVPDG